MPSADAQYYIKRNTDKTVKEDPVSAPKIQTKQTAPKKRSVRLQPKVSRPATLSQRNPATDLGINLKKGGELSAVEIETGCTDQELQVIQKFYSTLREFQEVISGTSPLSREDKKIIKRQEDAQRLLENPQKKEVLSALMSKCVSRPGFFASLRQPD